ncbi:MAG: hypothetical protein ACREL7_12115 [Longimicrobiales bacterium]
MDTSIATVIVLLGLVALRWVVIGIGVALLLRPVRECPACFFETFGLHHRLLRFAPWLEWRWCPNCGWHGPARRTGQVNHPLTDSIDRSASNRPAGERNRLSP